jgi:hypothetical protein
MSIQNNRAIRPLTLLTGLLIAVLALACSAHGQAMKGMANAGAAAPADAARPYSYVFLDPLEGQHTAQSNGANHVGVEMHGHWVIDVKNPDGTIAEHRDFENTITGYGQELLVGLMSGYVVPSDYGIFLQAASNSSPTPCAPVTSGFTGCGIVRSLTTLPASALCPNFTCFTSLTYAANLVDNTTSGSTFTLAGNFTASQAGTISSVTTMYGTCTPNIGTATALSTVSPSTCSTTAGSGGYRTVSQATITTVNVVASQIVQVTVTISFS